MPVLHTLAELRGKQNVTFGVWCEVERPGRVRRGDPVVKVAGRTSVETYEVAVDLKV